MLSSEPSEPLSVASQSPCLYLAQGPAAADESDKADESGSWQDLEKVPAGVVQKEDTLESGNAAKEQSVGNGVGAQGLGGVVEVGAKDKPCGKKHG